MVDFSKLPIVIEVADDPVLTARNGTSIKTGQPYQIPAKQIVYFHGVGRYPVTGDVVIPDSGPYRPGFYLLAGPTFRSGQYGVDFDERAALLMPLDQAMTALAQLKAPAK